MKLTITWTQLKRHGISIPDIWFALSPVPVGLDRKEFCDYFLASQHLQLTIGKALVQNSIF